MAEVSCSGSLEAIFPFDGIHLPGVPGGGGIQQQVLTLLPFSGLQEMMFAGEELYPVLRLMCLLSLTQVLNIRFTLTGEITPVTNQCLV